MQLHPFIAVKKLGLTMLEIMEDTFQSHFTSSQVSIKKKQSGGSQREQDEGDLFHVPFYPQIRPGIQKYLEKEWPTPSYAVSRVGNIRKWITETKKTGNTHTC